MALEEFLEHADEEALAEEAWSGEEEVLALAEELEGEVRIVDVVEVLGTDLAEGLDAGRQAGSANGLVHWGRSCVDSTG